MTYTSPALRTKIHNEAFGPGPETNERQYGGPIHRAAMERLKREKSGVNYGGGRRSSAPPRSYPQVRRV